MQTIYAEEVHNLIGQVQNLEALVYELQRQIIDLTEYNHQIRAERDHYKTYHDIKRREMEQERMREIEERKYRDALKPYEYEKRWDEAAQEPEIKKWYEEFNRQMKGL
jgi:hypothetical protein